MAHGAYGMNDRSSRPIHSPRRTSTRRERRITAIRINRRWGPARIGYLLGIHPSTVLPRRRRTPLGHQYGWASVINPGIRNLRIDAELREEGEHSLSERFWIFLRHVVSDVW